MRDFQRPKNLHFSKPTESNWERLGERLSRECIGEENRAEYIPYNSLDDIHDVIIIYDNSAPIACAAFKKYDKECAEVKRVFIKEKYRGKGISKKLMKQLEAKAKEKGYKYLILESGEPLVSAMALYRKIGYEVIPNYGQYKNMPDSICMKKEI